MDKDSKIFIAGISGMVGSSIARKLIQMGYSNIIGSYNSRIPNAAAYSLCKTKELPLRNIKLVKVDLKRQAEVNNFFKIEKPDYVFMAAAKVGGINANQKNPAQFIYENIAIQTNIIHAAYLFSTKRLLFYGSSCIYPKYAPQPIKEEYLLSGQLEPTNEPYAIAKISGIKMCEAYNQQYGTKFFSLMPTNLYGPNDNFDLETSHVLPALLRKFHDAKKSNINNVTVWGTGTPRREFLHVDDLADASFFLMNLQDSVILEHILNNANPSFINVGYGVDLTISELSHIIKEIVGFTGELVFDTSKPDGTPQKLLDSSRLSSLNWSPRISIENGIHNVYNWYLSKFD